MIAEIVTIVSNKAYFIWQAASLAVAIVLAIICFMVKNWWLIKRLWRAWRNSKEEGK